MRRYILVFLVFIILSCADNSRPEVLIIGDSISLGYTPYVKELLKEEAIVIHNEGNAEYTGTGLLMIDEWLGKEDWDVIHFNWGLWDMYGWRFKDTLRTPDVYARNLEILLARLEQTGAKLIWATTTPACTAPERNNLTLIDSTTEEAYRTAALRVMKKHKVQVNDLYTSIKPRQNEYAIGENDVHFTSEGSQFLAEQVANEIRKNLK
ncbi:MAG: SGNH/GDSL hydrolase family protein [Bacteroidetes bacterium]|nr:SGNH/GDSL hydrolase family protein [Bacteroidota bacterium]